MAGLKFPFAFSEDEKTQINGRLELTEPLPYTENKGGGFFRPGKVIMDDGAGIDVVLYHNPATAAFIYLRDTPIDPYLLDIIGLSAGETKKFTGLKLPGQLCMGSDRARLIDQAVRNLFKSPSFQSVFSGRRQQNMAVFPIAREGLKYQIPEAIYANFGFYCDEIILDAHHVFDSSVPMYNRKVEMTLFKDKDLAPEQKEDITVAFIADSIASGLVLKEVIVQIKKRFPRLENIEVIAPLTTIRGLCRIAESECSQDVKVRVHVFETLLNALPPDYYYSAHYNMPELHIRPDLEKEYRAWWGEDAQGNLIADTACAGYGWSEVFYSPRKQIQMMNDQLQQRHNLTIAEIVRRNATMG